MDRRDIRWPGMMGLLCAMVQMNDPIRGMFLSRDQPGSGMASAEPRG
jgi:hypothetical protein